jgi:hypothetical protein
MHFALAKRCCAAQYQLAFQASSPKTSSPAGNGRAFFSLTNVGVRLLM